MLIDDIYKRHIELKNFLMQQREVTFTSVIDEEFRRTFVLAIASHFESEFQKMIGDFITEGTSSRPVLSHLVHQKFMYRQYHAWFDWESRSANKFWSFFGADFKSIRLEDIKNDANLKESMSIFLELGDLRNKIVHQNFADFTVDLTVEEIYGKYSRAKDFIEYCKTVFC